MDAEKPWKWTRRFAVGLTVSVAGFSAFGALAPHIPGAPGWSPTAAGILLGCFYGNAQGLANCMAANSRTAWTRGNGYHLPAVFFFCCFVGFALLSMSGLDSSWEYVKGHAGDASLPDDGLMKALFWFVAFSEPAMNYGIQALKSLHKTEEREEERAYLDEAADRKARERDADARRKAFHTVPPAAAAAVVAIGTAGMPMADFQIDPVSHSAPASTDAQAHASHGWRGPRDQAKWDAFKAAHGDGLSPTEIIARTGISSTTCYRWCALLNGKAAAA